MSVVVEDGTIVSGANSYVSTTELSTYAANRGLTIAGDTTELLIQAMDYIESLEFIGIRWTKDQPLLWPRVYVYIDGYYQDVTHIPIQLKEGQMEVALAIDAGNGPLIDLDPQVSRERVGDLEVEYMKGTFSVTTVRKINAKLRKILANGGNIVVRKA